MTNKPFDHEKVTEIIMDMHTLIGLTARRAQKAGVDKKTISKVFDLSAGMTAALLAKLNISADTINKVLMEKIEDMEKSIDTDESKEAVVVEKANILGDANDAVA